MSVWLNQYIKYYLVPKGLNRYDFRGEWKSTSIPREKFHARMGKSVIVTGALDVNLFILSVFLGILSTFTTLNILLRVIHSQGMWKKVWMYGGSLVIGLGYWTMYFTSLIALTPNDSRTFNVFMIGFTLLFSIICSYLTVLLIIKAKERNGKVFLVLGAVTIALIMSLRKFLDIQSLELEGELMYQPLYGAVSFLMGALTGGIGLYWVWRIEKNGQKLSHSIFSSIVIGMGVSSANLLSNQFIVVKATTFPSMIQAHLTLSYFSKEVPLNAIAYGIGFSTILIIAIVVAMAYIDKAIVEKLLKQTDIQYKSLVDQNPCLVLTINQDGSIQHVNPKGIDILHGSKDDIVSKPLLSFFHKDDQDRVSYLLGHPHDEGQRVLEASIFDLSGKTIPMSITFVPIMVDGHRKGTFLVGTDVSALYAYKIQIEQAQKDLLDTLKKQQGLTLKYKKIGDRFVHTLCEGELLHKLGLTPDMVVGKSLEDLVLPEDYPTDIKLEAYRKAWDGNVTEYEAELNGVYYYVILSPAYKDGEIVEVIGSGVDITDRKKAEQTLIRNEKWHRNILSTMSEGIMLYGADHSIQHLNHSVYDLFGIQKDVLQKESFDPESIQFYSSDGTPLKLEDSPVNISFTTGEPVMGQILGVSDYQYKKWLSVNTKLLDSEEYGFDVPTVLLTMSDVTLEKEQQNILRESNALRSTLIDSLPFGILVVDSAMNMVAVNRPFCRMFQIEEPMEELIGKNYMPYRKAILKERVSNGGDTKNEKPEGKMEIKEFQTVDGRTYKQGYFPFYMDQELKGHLWTFEDVTEQKMLDEVILSAKEEAIQANLAKSEFLSNMSHELRTPLNGILGFSQLLEMDESLTEQQMNFTQEILKGGRHLLALINEILDLSRIETGKMKISHERVQVSKIMEESVNLVLHAAHKKSITIHKEFIGDPNQEVYIDQMRVRQILLNLLDNAIKYNREHGEVILTCEVRDESMIVHVRDTGFGIPSHESDRIFEPFYRLENQDATGAGIGLALVKQLIQLMGGEIQVNSEVGKGSDFGFWLPIKNALSGTKAFPKPTSIELVHNRNQPNILYIEDNPSNVQLVREIVGMIQGFDLYTASSGQEGLKMAADLEFDLILLDINLPDLNGYEVFNILKSEEKTKAIPIIALSANAMESEIKDAMSKGFSDYLTKPISISNFIHTIHHHL
ncbi:PAS domain S-box protein [Peribacillus acanthi]|uniref:PAS domain S-box protein n=1 Tax=Peribacillus acanthi TaxID=2171554 RepID=UPI0013005967|nr:PAS domain S-box protein [Peribacillus acanthi]